MPGLTQPAPTLHTLENVQTESGVALSSLTAAQPTLLVFLRHWGCSFCRQTLSDLAPLRPQLRATGVELVFVHMGAPERARPYFDYYQLSDVQRISDPEQKLYRDPAFALPAKAVFTQLFDPKVLKNWLGGVIRQHGIGLIFREDPDQMPGAFLLDKNRILRTYRYKSIADRPDFLKLARLPA